MLRVVVDATPLLPKPSGVGLYVANLLAALNQLQAEEKFELGIVYQPSLKNWLRGHWQFPELLQQYENLHFLPLPVRVLNLLAHVPSNPLLPYFEKRFGAPDVMHGTNYAVYPCRHSLRVMNIYDLTFLRYPEYANAVARTYAARIKRCLAWTDLVITISESSKQDMVEYLQVAPEKIWVTPLASRYSAEHDRPQASLVGAQSLRYDFSQPYILFVSTIEPRKNITTLISAFNQLKTTHKIDHHLVLIGQRGWCDDPIFEAIARSPWRHCIHHLNYVPDNLVAWCYMQADVFVYPSHYEGFGMPVLEAMTLGCPVVTSNTSSLPEVAGDAALLVQPTDVEQLVDAVLRVVSDRTLRQNLIQKGHARAKLFSWQRTAWETLQAYRYCVSV